MKIVAEYGLSKLRNINKKPPVHDRKGGQLDTDADDL